tara:strand:- start:30 stop:221 length:192 start_codon:yes stop_codon:yes gene_type:complete
MKILSAKYYKDATGTGQVVGIKVTTPETSATHMVSVPIAERNSDYQEILEWAKIDGNNIEAAD